MYDGSTIAVLEARIGFGSDTGIPVSVDTSLKSGTSGRTFDHFHKLVNLDNLYHTVETVNASESVFESDLQQMISNAARSALVKVVDQSIRSKPETDYSESIQENIELFDEVLGYELAISALEMMVSSSRQNDEKRNANATYSKLKVELEGLTDENGMLRSVGIKTSLNRAVRKAQNKMFPWAARVSGKPIW